MVSEKDGYISVREWSQINSRYSMGSSPFWLYLCSLAALENGVPHRQIRSETDS